MHLPDRYPKSSAAGITGITLIAGAAVVILADFGAPIWVFGLLLLWPATVGLPSTVAVLLVASLWGRTPWAAGFPGFVLVSALVAWVFQWMALTAWNGWRRRKTSLP